MPPPPYSRDQADKMLPLLAAIVKDVRACYLRMRAEVSARQQREPWMATTAEAAIGFPLQAELGDVRGLLVELSELGATLQDPELGLVSFRGALDGRVVNFCWKLGEDRVRYWYEIHASYTERTPLDPVPAR